jgi:dienelactone hydrolase
LRAARGGPEKRHSCETDLAAEEGAMSDTIERAVGETPVEIPVGGIRLDGDLGVPVGAEGLVLFAHGSGSSRLSPRNRLVAGELREAGLATLLFDLLTPEEEEIDRATRRPARPAHRRASFDIELLAWRLVGATDWILSRPGTAGLRLGYFGASTGSAAALIAATERPGDIGAVVSRGGRPDLAERVLDRVRAPTLLVVGGRDLDVLDMNREALGRLRSKKELAVVPGATHLFEEPGALEEVARLARDWFLRHLGGRAG